MASSSDSMSFDINNQLGIPDNGEENSTVEPNMTEETSDVRARGQESQQPQEEVTLRSLMDFMSKKFEENKREQDEIRREQAENFAEIRREQAENNKLLSEKLDMHKEEVKQKMAEQFTLLRTRCV